jgi:hypothetical protein
MTVAIFRIITSLIHIDISVAIYAMARRVMLRVRSPRIALCSSRGAASNTIARAIYAFTGVIAVLVRT